MTSDGTVTRPRSEAAAPDLEPRIILVPGLGGSGPTHWQSIWGSELPGSLTIAQDDWNDPRPADWIGRIEEQVAGISGAVMFVAHSLGCLAVAGWAQRHGESRVAVDAMMVAPCSTGRADALDVLRRFRPFSEKPLGFSSLVVASANDPYASVDESVSLAKSWGSNFVDVGALGHINAASDLGRWPGGLHLLGERLRLLTGAAENGDREKT